MDKNTLIKNIKQRREILIRASKNLKQYFIGLDKIIDKIISSIEAWYLFPEIVSRPIIINLWGMTGVGKTDLVRRLVKELQFHDKFVEIQMEGKGDNTWNKEIHNILRFSGIEEGKEGILLLDEFQRFRTIDKDLDDVDNDKYQDIWMLLSDGKFNTSSKIKRKLIESILDLLYSQDKDEDDDEGNILKESGNKKSNKFKISFWEADNLKCNFKLTEPVEEIMKWSTEKTIKILQSKLNDVNLFSNLNYSKLLIFICGNLDEAYNAFLDCSDTESDADILHQLSKKINILDIKRSLKNRFRPEQISRLGNNHIIYPLFNKNSFYNLIDKKLNEIRQFVKDNVNVNINFDNQIKELIYRNGVYPSQGVRPLFSTINNIIETHIPTIIIDALETNTNNVNITFNEKLVYITNKDNYININCDIDIIKKKNDTQSKYLIAVHEAAHGLVYALLTGYAPVMIKINSTNQSGDAMRHTFFESKNQMLYSIKIGLAGIIAENIIFGKEYTISGSKSDLRKVTGIASAMVREYGLYDSFGRIHTEFNESASNFITSINETNPQIENIIKQCSIETSKLINDNLKILKKLSDYLIKNIRMDSAEFIKIVNPYMDIKILDSDETIYENYKKLYEANFSKFNN